MDKQTKRWIKLMNVFDKYWGCHQIPERSFFFKKYQFPVCARCTGIIVGEILSIIIFIFYKHIPILILFFLLSPLIIDGSIQFISKYESNNLKRLFTGILFGFSFATLIIYLLWFLIGLIT